jgi:hypothetical protein
VIVAVVQTALAPSLQEPLRARLCRDAIVQLRRNYSVGEAVDLLLLSVLQPRLWRGVLAGEWRSRVSSGPYRATAQVPNSAQGALIGQPQPGPTGPPVATSRKPVVKR